MEPDILFIDNHDFESSPFGGTLTFAQQLLSEAGDRFALVGVTVDPDFPVGKWATRMINGREYSYFAYRRIREDSKKTLLPHRLLDYLALRRYLPTIREKGLTKVFVQIQHGAMVCSNYQWDGFAVLIPGLSNIVRHSKYKWLRCFGALYEHAFFRALRKAECVLAAADERTIERFVVRSGSVLRDKRIHPFPTRIDVARVPSIQREEARSQLELAGEKLVLFCARISWRKGWRLVLEGFLSIRNEIPDANLVVVGDGEDMPQLREYVEKHHMEERIIVLGQLEAERVMLAFKAVDVYALGSFEEGWPTTMVEALAAGLAIVSTDVSGASTMIREGVNGHVVRGRDPKEFGAALARALNLSQAGEVSRRLASHYDVRRLPDDLAGCWESFRENSVS